jgi:hypothetical protein
MIDRSMMEAWMRRGIEILTAAEGGAVETWDDLDCVEPGWTWSERTMVEASSIFEVACEVVPADWSGVFNMTVVLPLSETMIGAADGIDLVSLEGVRPSRGYPPYFYLYSLEYFASNHFGSLEQFEWVWDGNPWGLCPPRARVSFVSSRSLVEKQMGEEFSNRVEFTRYSRDYVESRTVFP